MCEFASWIEKDGDKYFLKDSDLQTKEGRRLVKKLKDSGKYYEDICGHGAIKEYYPELKNGIEKECTDFSKLSNFPGEIVEAIKEKLQIK